MSEYLLPTLIKVFVPAIGIGLITLVAKKKKLSFSDDLGFAIPVISATALFLVLWLALIAVEEVLQQSAPKAWKDYPSGIIALRILAIGLLGPIAEELAFSRLTDVGSQAHTNWSVRRRVCDCSTLVHGPHTARPGNTGADLY